MIENNYKPLIDWRWLYSVLATRRFFLTWWWNHPETPLTLFLNWICPLTARSIWWSMRALLKLSVCLRLALPSMRCWSILAGCVWTTVFHLTQKPTVLRHVQEIAIVPSVTYWQDMLHGDVLSCVDMYFQLCSLSVTARSLAGMSLVLSADGVDPKMGERLLDKRVVRTMKTLMFTCDMYDESGEYACRVGIPSKVVWVRRYYGLCRRMYGHWMLWPRPWHKRQQYWRHLYNGTAVWHIEATCIWCR